MSAEDTYPFDLGTHEHKISTKNKTAQVWFNRGLLLCYSYNHEEAVRCFQQCIEKDSSCAMGYWGVAIASGINYNNYASLDQQNCEVAFKYSRKALEIVQKDGTSFSELEQCLISALQCRYSEIMPDDSLLSHQRQFSDEMRMVYDKFSDVVDVCAIFAESLMLLNPWKLWSKDGQPGPNTVEITSILETAISKFPPHPGIYHLFIHAVELSPNPRQALQVADVLSGLVPDSGHLLHMPSHIYILLGMYRKAVTSNLAGIEADKKFLEKEGDDNFYTLYRLHNYHFVVYASMFEGNYQVAIEHANQLVSQITPKSLLKMADWFETFLSIPLHVLVRFGKWSAILSLPPPSPPPNTDPHFFAVTWSFYHYARGIAYASLNNIAAANAEQQQLLLHLPHVAVTRTLFNNRAIDILEIAKAMLLGECDYRSGNYTSAFDHLRRAIALDDALPYDEPWGWMQPVRHAAGALLLEQGRVAEAEVMYSEDLTIHPDNCWALHGLEECMRLQGRLSEASEVKARLEKVTQWVDVPLKASCFCRLGVF